MHGLPNWIESLGLGCVELYWRWTGIVSLFKIRHRQGGEEEEREERRERERGREAKEKAREVVGGRRRSLEAPR